MKSGSIVNLGVIEDRRGGGSFANISFSFIVLILLPVSGYIYSISFCPPRVRLSEILNACFMLMNCECI